MPRTMLELAPLRPRPARARGLCRLCLVLLASLAAPLPTLGPSPLHAQSAQPVQARQTDLGLHRLDAEIRRLAEVAGGRVGVAAVHLETGRAVYLNRGEAFPMASSYKVPIAVQLLTRVDWGQIRLDSMVTLQPGDLHPGSGTLTELFDDPGVALSLRNLLELTLLISDNSATDLVLRTAGGPQAVTARMRELGVQGIRVDRPTVHLIGDWLGIRELRGDDVSPQRFSELAAAVPEAERRAAAAAFETDARDTSTPEDMALLLQKICRGEGLSSTSAELLLDIMRRSTTGTGRIKGMLPPDVQVSHKTGTIGGTTNDVGIIRLPDQAGHVAVVVFVKESERSVEQRERAIALISRAAYDYFLFNPGVAGNSTR